MYVLELAGEADDFAAAEARTAGRDVRVVAPGLATAAALDPDRFRTLAFSHRASHLLAETAPTADAAREALASVGLDGSGTVAVRARDVRSQTSIDTQAVERALGSILVDAGYAVDLESPDRELLALFAEDACRLAWVVAIADRGFGQRAPTDRPFFQPGSMEPHLARAVVNLAGVDPGETVLDPMCGTGGMLIEAGLIGAVPVGFDAQERMVRGAARNLRSALDRPVSLARADATRLPVRDDSVAAAVFDVPYGRQSKIERHALSDLIDGALSEAARVAARGVVVADRKLADRAAAAGWSDAERFERPVHRSLVRHVHVLR
ncbi:MAG: methyltransferase domain-containing protein [Halodesulfurarchaeum sp.]